jgi:hypothetical protein
VHSITGVFHQSTVYTATAHFTQTKAFNMTSDFNESNPFLITSDFNESNIFIVTSGFNESDTFTRTNDFSDSLSLSSSHFISESTLLPEAEFISTSGFNNSHSFCASNISASQMFCLSMDQVNRASEEFVVSKNLEASSHFDVDTGLFRESRVLGESESFNESDFPVILAEEGLSEGTITAISTGVLGISVGGSLGAISARKCNKSRISVDDVDMPLADELEELDLEEEEGKEEEEEGKNRGDEEMHVDEGKVHGQENGGDISGSGNGEGGGSAINVSDQAERHDEKSDNSDSEGVIPGSNFSFAFCSFGQAGD